MINPLTVAENRSGKKRLVLDCRHILTLADVSVGRDLFSAGDFLFKFDLKSAYHHIMVLDSHRKYLGFKWVSKENVRYFRFNVLPFGLATAGYIFTKFTREMIKFWRSEGYKIVMYLDDGLGGHSSYEFALQVSDYIHGSLSEFGFLIAEEKCEWIPKQNLIWLGI